MLWPGTLIGAGAGFAIASIPGAMLGALLGQALDRRLHLQSWGHLREKLGGRPMLRNDELLFVFSKGIGYAFQLGLRPQSMYGIADSPMGLASYLLDHDARSYALIASAFAGKPSGISRDDFLDNITLTWLTNTGVSSGRLYWENKLGFFNAKGIKIPVAVTVFPDELYPAPRSWSQQAFPTLIHYNRVDRGGHFAAWEQPKIFSEEMRASFKSLRS